MRAEFRRDDRLRRLPDTVGTALDKGADVDNRTVDRQRVRAEKAQYRLLQEPDTGPRQHRQQHGGQHGRREIRVRLCLPRRAAAALGAEQDAAADTREQAETVDDVPHRRHDRQRRRTVRPLILADHRHVHNAVNARDERAAERCQNVSAVERTHIAPEQVQKHPPRKRKKPDKEQTFQSAPYPAAVSLNSSPSSERGCYARRKMDCQAGKWLTRCPAVCTRCP